MSLHCDVHDGSQGAHYPSIDIIVRSPDQDLFIHFWMDLAQQCYKWMGGSPVGADNFCIHMIMIQNLCHLCQNLLAVFSVKAF